MLRGFRDFICLFLAWVTVVSPIAAQSKPVTVRNLAAEPGLYLSRYSEVTGTRIGDYDKQTLDALALEMSRLESEVLVYDSDTDEVIRDEAVAQKMIDEHRAVTRDTKKVLFLVGIPIFGSERKAALERVHTWLASLNLKNPPKIRTISRPSGHGIRRIAQELTTYVPWIIPKTRFNEDLTPTSKLEKRKGWQSVSVSSGITIPLQTLVQGLWVGLPAALTNMIFSISTTIPRQVLMNYFTRHNWTLDNIVQQFVIGSFFAAGVYWMGRGSFDAFSTIATVEGWQKFFSIGIWVIFLQIFWRLPLEKGQAKFVELEDHAGRGAVARATMAEMRKWTTITATNLWAVSLLFKYKLFHFGFDWNFGHVGMALIGLMLYPMYLKPERFSIFYKDRLKAALWEAKKFSGHCVNKLRRFGQMLDRGDADAATMFLKR